MDDTLFVGKEAHMEVTETASQEAWRMTGFAATKHWTRTRCIEVVGPDYC